MTLTHDGPRLYSNPNYKKGGFTPFTSQPGFGATDEIGSGHFNIVGNVGLGDDSLYSDIGVDPNYGGTQISTLPPTGVTAFFGGIPTSFLLIAGAVIVLMALPVARGR